LKGDFLALSLFDFSGKDGKAKGYIINKYSHEKLKDDAFFVSNMFGSWVVLNQKEFDLLRFEQIEKDPKFFNELERTGIIITQENQEKVMENIRSRNSFLNSSVTLHIISPTLRCNQKCIYCHARAVHADAKGFDMDEDVAKATVDFILQSPSKNMSIEKQGVEPLLAFNTVRFITDYASKMAKKTKKNITFIIQSNFTAMDDDMAKFLADNKFRIGTSLDGPKKIHDKNRKYLGGTGTYNDVVGWIRKFRSEYKVDVNALPTITKFSLPYYKEIVDEYKSLGIMSIVSRTLNVSGLAKDLWNKLGFTAEEYLEYWRNLLDYILEINKSGIVFTEYMATTLVKKFLSNSYTGYTCWGSPCGAGLSQAAYDHDGNIYMCDESRSYGDTFTIGNVGQKYEDVFLSPAVSSIVGVTSGLSKGYSDSPWYPFIGSCAVCTFGDKNNIMANSAGDKELAIKKGMAKYVLEKLVFSGDRKYLVKWVS